MTGVTGEDQAVCKREPGLRTIIDTNDRNARKRSHDDTVSANNHNVKRPSGIRERGAAQGQQVIGGNVSQPARHDHIAIQQSHEAPKDQLDEYPTELSEAEEIARRRLLRAQILAKYDTDRRTKDVGDLAKSALPEVSVVSTPVSSPRSEPELDLAKNATQQDSTLLDDDGPAAADYNPDIDRIVEHEAHREQHQIRSRLNLSTDSSNVNDRNRTLFNQPVDDDEDDMFADPSTPASDQRTLPDSRPTKSAHKLDETTLDSWADTEGYYRIMIGELLNGRYAVQNTLGKGVFSAVVRAIDQHDGESVAIKVIRNNDVMRKAGMKEISILETLMAADPDDRKHIVRLKSTFEHRGHLCLVFESLSLNLREVLKKFGRDVGINLKAVRAYAQQIFLGLSLMRKCNIMHADLKPDNILVSESRTLLKICDLGSASDVSENDLTPYLASRFYRAPEVILGLPYDASMDIWAVGCTLYEMYTGKILFPGRSNNQMLRLFMECRGRMPQKLLKKAAFCATHFDDQFNFNSVEVDKITGEDTIRVLNISKATKDFKLRLLQNASPEERGLLAKFVDLLEKCTELDSSRRITPNEALKHPFLARS